MIQNPPILQNPHSRLHPIFAAQIVVVSATIFNFLIAPAGHVKIFFMGLRWRSIFQITDGKS
jgi:hypothetical protein